MPKFVPSFGGYSGPKPVLHLIAGTLLLSTLAWLAVQVALVSMDPEYGTNDLNAQRISISYTVYDYQWRSIAVASALATSYYAARWPMSRSATFMGFINTVCVASSFIPIDLKNAYTEFFYGINRCPNVLGVNNKWCALQYGAQVLSVTQTGLIALLSLWALARHLVADTYPHLIKAEHASHALVWVGTAAYLCWCGAAAAINIDLTVDSNTDEFMNQWSMPSLHVVSIAGLTLAAYVSWGSTRGARVNALLLAFIGLVVLTPSVIWDARQMWDLKYRGTNTCAVSFSNHLCMAKNGIVAGMGGVAGVFLVLCLDYLLLLATPVRGDVYAYNNQSANQQQLPAVKPETQYVQPSQNGYSQTTTAAYPSYDTAPAYGTPSNRYVASTTASPYPPV